MSGLKVLRAMNSSVEYLDHFNALYDWADLLMKLPVEPDLFLSARILVETSDFERLAGLCNAIPQSVDKYVSLARRFVITPDEGLCRDEDVVYSITISIHPGLARNAVAVRQVLNEYFDEIREQVSAFRRS